MFYNFTSFHLMNEMQISGANSFSPIDPKGFIVNNVSKNMGVTGEVGWDELGDWD